MIPATETDDLAASVVDEVAVQRAAAGHRCPLTLAERREVIHRVADGEVDRRLAAEGLGVTLAAVTRAIDRLRKRTQATT